MQSFIRSAIALLILTTLLYGFNLPITISAWDTWGSRPPALKTSANGIYFDFPLAKRGRARTINYLTTNWRAPISGTLIATFRISTVGPVVFHPVSEPGQCLPARTRLYLERVGWDRTPYPEAYNYRWFANPISAVLVGGSTVQLSVPLTPDQWSNVNGKYGNQDATTIAGFNGTLNNPETIGFAFGGSCFFGHGVNVSGGTARFELLNFSIN